MKTPFKRFASLVLLAGIAGCEPLGDGSTAESLRITLFSSDFEQGLYVAATDTEPEYIKMYDCFCSNFAVIAKFTDGAESNFVYRAQFSSSNPDVVQVLNQGQDGDDRCPLAQTGPGALIPRGVGEATITAEFGGLKDTMLVRVHETAPLAAGNFTIAAAPPATSNAVLVGAQLPMSVTGTLDGRKRNLNRNVRAWTLDPVNPDIVTVDSAGTLTGVAADPAGTLRTLTASFGDNCPVTVATVDAVDKIAVGDILGPLSLAREPGFVADPVADHLLATDTDEFLRVIASLDFDADGDEDATQVIDNLVTLSFEDACTLRVYDASVPGTNCAETAGTCTNTTQICATATATSCPASLTTPCRTNIAPVIGAAGNRILAVADSDAEVQFKANYPRLVGDKTTLKTAVDAGTTTLEVAGLVRYPQDPPWYGVIDKDGLREDVRVTASTIAADGSATLTVVRGVSGGGVDSFARPHDAGVSFQQRPYVSTTLGIQGQESTLTLVAIETPGALAAHGTLQMQAQGTFTDPDSGTRQQRITHLASLADTTAPSIQWGINDFTGRVATINTTGLVTSRTACGGEFTIRARLTTSTNTAHARFDNDSTTDDDACIADALCDQVTLTVAPQSPLPDGTTCD